MPGGRPRMNLVGQRFTRLRVEAAAGTDKRNNTLWRCVCECGQQITVKGSRLRAGSTRSCGCLARDLSSERLKRDLLGNESRLTHGHNRPSKGGASPTYQTWTAMLARCRNPGAANYPNYGGRGITACDRWATSFEAFLADMGERPDGHTLDRIDAEGNYEPGNCRWATQAQQAKNRRQKTSSDHTGVAWDRNKRRWMAYVDRDGRRTYLGRFVNEADAAAAVRAYGV